MPILGTVSITPTVAPPVDTSVVLSLYRQYTKVLLFERTLVLALGDQQTMDDVTKALLQRLDDVTNAIAAKIQALIDKANAAGSVAAAEIDTALSPIVDQLESLGKP